MLLRAQTQILHLVPWIAAIAAGVYLLHPELTQPLVASPPRMAPAPIVVTPTVETIAPLNGARMTDSADVVFSWRLVWPASRVEDRRTPSLVLEISQAENFTANVTREVPISDPTAPSITVKLPVGQFYWRFRMGLEALSETRKLTIEAPIAPAPKPQGVQVTLRSPSDGKEIESDGPELAFSWREPARVAGISYELEIARDANFRNHHKSFRTTRPSLAPKKLALAPGVYFWRVKRAAPGQPTRASETFTFTLSESALIAPKSNVKVNK